MTIEYLSRIQADIAFINAQRISGEYLTHSSEEVAVLAHKMIAAAKYNVLVADSWTFGEAAFFRIRSLRIFDG